MSRKSAVTESVSYRVEECHVCSVEVGLGKDIPEDELVKPGYAVLIGERTVSITNEQAGNWDVEVEFEGEQSDTTPPSVQGYILCAECAEAIHGQNSDAEFYRGPLPNALVTGTETPELPMSERTLFAIVVVLLLLLVFLLF